MINRKLFRFFDGNSCLTEEKNSDLINLYKILYKSIHWEEYQHGRYDESCGHERNRKDGI